MATLIIMEDGRSPLTWNIMQLSDLPLELLEKIVHFSVRVRTFKRALRLRLVNSKVRPRSVETFDTNDLTLE